MNIVRSLIAASTLVAWPTAALAGTVSSPDGRIVATLEADGEGIPVYEVSFNGEPVIARSTIGFNFTDADPMRRGFEVIAETTDSVDATWEQPWGERRFVRDNHNELAVTFRQQDEAAREMTVRMRVFDDGLGFRMEFPEQASMPVANIAEELTEFRIAGDGEAWSIQAGDWNRYEYLYERTPISALSTVHTPVTMVLENGTHVSFHEAALVDYSGMWLRRMEGTNFRAQLAPSPRGPKVVREGAFHTPWRTIQIADGPAGLFESAMILNLNEPNALGDVSWFKPHKYIGIWWEMHLDESSWNSGDRHGATTANAMRYIDFAAEHGFRGVLIEGWNVGWDGTWFGNGRDFSFTQSYPDFDIEAVAAYAAERGVRIIGHHETGGNIGVYERQLEEAMAFYESLGIDAVKTGYVADAGGVIAPDGEGGEVFVWHDGQEAVQHHLRVVRIAADHHIAVNPHEPVKDTGLRRTYPNWVSREGARGAEYDAWGVPKNGPDHVPEMIFTRLLSGPMDYTPGVFSLRGRGAEAPDIPSTLARQLAFYVAIYSPIQMVADLPENIAAYPEALDWVQRVPADWSESRLLDGAVGEYAVIARRDRNSQGWYIGGVTDAEARDATVALDFLDPGTAYVATIWEDGETADGLGEDRHALDVRSYTVTSTDTLTLHMARAGGFAIELAPAGE
ncbi:glycoside hydrolase family 97 protein [Alteraurantiacibacter aquimixticola]|uniref:Glycoside hydrolase family 97 protein n=1 Tax=Alteraurantiacibacter aquimixticola TaxID=2489173 RepID=A0A4T3F5H2_9SPHN|nr:glycoside hydrolase family 97 protein [Alteraurantiacibacter aquimixticola]TIX51729.1 glycoside hydrolase family 97 protein [Alteraurantiacibacter aquimixticola]